MIQVILTDETIKEFHSAKSALRFMYAMKSKGYLIMGWRCDDSLDNEWLSYRFKL